MSEGGQPRAVDHSKRCFRFAPGANSKGDGRMKPSDLVSEVVDNEAYERALKHLSEARVLLPTLEQLRDPSKIPPALTAALAQVDAAAPEPENLFRVHWFNDRQSVEQTDIPGYLELPQSITGVEARIVVALGERFPMIAAHKVLPAYGCLVPRIITGRFDPTRHKAIWPSTGNYCRGGVAISRILGCRGVAVLPEGMSSERFEWLQGWVSHPDDVVRTPGSESNVKEIYDKCAELAADPSHVILNQFSEFGNYLVHYTCTGYALERIFQHLLESDSRLALAAFVAGTGSAGTLGAGDYLKARYGSRIVAVEPVECPTMLYNGYGEHNIQGIGDKHIPLIQNVMNMDVVAGVSDHSCDCLNVLFNTESGRSYLERRRHLEPGLVQSLSSLGLSGIANVLAAIKTARRLELSHDELVITVATDGAGLYVSEREKTEDKYFGEEFDQMCAAEVFSQHMIGVDGDHLMELSYRDRRRIFNLGYYTWVEQQGVALEDFDRRKHQYFWQGLKDIVPVWDDLIEEFNGRTGVSLPA